VMMISWPSEDDTGGTASSEWPEKRSGSTSSQHGVCVFSFASEREGRAVGGMQARGPIRNDDDSTLSSSFTLPFLLPPNHYPAAMIPSRVLLDRGKLRYGF
jgi:hypothetical protein